MSEEILRSYRLASIQSEGNATALSTTAAFFLHGSRNGWEYWMNEDGIQLGLIEGLRKNNE